MGNVRMAYPGSRVYIRGFPGRQHTYMRVFGPFLFLCRIYSTYSRNKERGNYNRKSKLAYLGSEKM